jgi:hypothetical protein
LNKQCLKIEQKWKKFGLKLKKSRVKLVLKKLSRWKWMECPNFNSISFKKRSKSSNLVSNLSNSKFNKIKKIFKDKWKRLLENRIYKFSKIILFLKIKCCLKDLN